MNKIKEMFTTYFKNRSVMFYIGFGVSVLSIVIGIVYISVLSPISSYTRAYIAVLPILAGICYLLAGLFKKTRIGAVAMAILNFSTFLCYAGTIYNYPIEQAMVVTDILAIPYLITIIVIAVIMLLTTILSNVLIWTPLEKKLK